MTAKKRYPFEESLAKLEALVEKMESGELSLEDSLSTFEEGIKLTRSCQDALKQAEQKVQILMEKGGEVSTEPFPEREDD
ncbi:MAG: exodeoxyribonuclease VII small subunit [Candidatus Azotimanducaceae bacterium]|jgi:exodeoxyribonuclease VII small subunit